MQPSGDQKARIAGIFDRASATYGQVGAGFFTYFGEQLVLRAGIGPGMRVLDVACGRGAVLFPAAQAVGQTGSATGIDLSPGMVTALSADIQARGIYNATAQVMDAEHLTFSDAAFDAVTCGFAIFLIPDRARVLRNVHRVLAPDGRLGISTWSPEVSDAEKARWGWFDELVKTYTSRRSGAATQPTSPLSASATNMLDAPESLAEGCRQAGFRDVSVESETATFAYRSPEDWWQARWSIFFRAALEALPPDALADLEAKSLAHLREMQAGGELITEMTAVFTLARK